MKRPRWIVPVAVIGLGLVALTWHQHFPAGVDYSLILTILVSFTALKAITLIFDYKRFHASVAKMLPKDKGRNVVLVDIGASVIGLLFVLIAFLVY